MTIGDRRWYLSREVRALAWPLDLFQYVPLLDVTVIGAVTVLLAGLAALDMTSGKKLRVPFEILWPTGALALLLAMSASAWVANHLRPLHIRHWIE